MIQTNSRSVHRLGIHKGSVERRQTVRYMFDIPVSVYSLDFKFLGYARSLDMSLNGIKLSAGFGDMRRFAMSKERARIVF